MNEESHSYESSYCSMFNSCTSNILLHEMNLLKLDTPLILQIEVHAMKKGRIDF